MKKWTILLLTMMITSMVFWSCSDDSSSEPDTGTNVVFQTAVQTGGISGTTNSTGLTLTFDVDPTTLTADNIMVTGATLDTLKGSGTIRNLEISSITIDNEETVSVAITSPSGYSISGSSQTAVVYRKIYALRDTGPAGGLIFYDKGSYSDGWRYLEAALKSTEWADKVWGGYRITATGAVGIEVGTGKQNTIYIVEEFGESEPYADNSDYAAKLCSDLVIGEYEDWFLPSKYELNEMYVNLKEEEVGGFVSDYYWSSSEIDSVYAWSSPFGSGVYVDDNKTWEYLVRAVRDF